jgi:hypothetical protein
MRMLQMIKKETADYSTLTNEEITLEDGRKAYISFLYARFPFLFV